MKNREATSNLGIEKLTSDVRKLGLMLIWLKNTCYGIHSRNTYTCMIFHLNR